jgi:hypothetical protein
MTTKNNPNLPCAYNLDLPCSEFTLVNDQDSSFVNNIINEALNIASAPVNVFKLLGIWEQTKLVDLTGQGQAISSGQYPAFPASNAFDNTISEWRSTQKGPQIIGNSYIGYDFGPIRLDNSRVRYGIDTSIKQHITTIKIKQGCNGPNKATKLRVERSVDNVKWYGVDIITIPDTDDMVTLRIKQSAPARYWRFTPLAFSGGVNDFWAVTSLQLIDYASVQLSDVQDEMGFLENRDREYASTSIQIKAYYDLVDVSLDLTRFGIHIPETQTWVFQVGFSSAVNLLGRPLVIGDILEVPSEIQYTPGLKPVKKYLEVTDVSWSTQGFTPGWKPTILRVIAAPAFASQETIDIFGDLNPPSNVNNYEHLNDPRYMIDADVLNQRVNAEADTEVPERGEDIANVREFTLDELATAAEEDIDLSKLNVNPQALYVEDAIPPNGLPYTEGPAFPWENNSSNPNDGAYHRITYPQVSDPIPPRLYRWKLQKNRWIFLEEDKRLRYNPTKPTLQSYLNDGNAIPMSKLGK